MLSCRSFVLGALTAALLALPAAAVPSGFDVIFSAEDEAGNGLGSQNLAGLQTMGIIDEEDVGPDVEAIFLSEAMQAGTGWMVTSWRSEVKEDPFITNNFVVVNNTGGTATFTFIASTPIPAFNANEIVESNIILGLNDDDNAGPDATATTVSGTAMYQGQVNGSTELILLPDPYSLSCSSPTDCAVNGNGLDSDGVASMAFGPVVANSIGIIVKFTLTDGDSLSVQSRFEIVPEPTTAMLLGLGLGLLGVAGRRRQ